MVMKGVCALRLKWIFCVNHIATTLVLGLEVRAHSQLFGTLVALKDWSCFLLVGCGRLGILRMMVTSVISSLPCLTIWTLGRGRWFFNSRMRQVISSHNDVLSTFIIYVVNDV